MKVDKQSCFKSCCGWKWNENLPVNGETKYCLALAHKKVTKAMQSLLFDFFEGKYDLCSIVGITNTVQHGVYANRENCTVEWVGQSSLAGRKWKFSTLKHFNKSSSTMPMLTINEHRRFFTYLLALVSLLLGIMCVKLLFKTPVNNTFQLITVRALISFCFVSSVQERVITLWFKDNWLFFFEALAYGIWMIFTPPLELWPNIFIYNFCFEM